MAQIQRIKGRMISLHHAVEVLDQNDDVLYRVKSNAISLHDTTHITDAQGNEVAKIHAKTLSLHNIYYVAMTESQSFELSSELFHLNDVIDIPELNWQLQGDIFEFDFQVIDNATGSLLAQAQREIVTLHGVYDLAVYDEAHRDELVAVFAVLKHLIDRRITEKAMDDNTANAH